MIINTIRWGESFCIRLYPIPASLLVRESLVMHAVDSQATNLGAPVAIFASPVLHDRSRDFNELHFSEGYYRRFLDGPPEDTQISLFSYPSFEQAHRSDRTSHAYVQRFICHHTPDKVTAEVQGSRNKVMPNMGTSAEHVFIGDSGQRGVWIERAWEKDEARLMKVAWSSDGKTRLLAELVPPHIALPFAPRACNCIAFDESVGRVALACSGSLYILDF
jgi:hypothetical protein